MSRFRAVASIATSPRDFNPNEIDHYGNTPLLETIRSEYPQEEKLSLIENLLQPPKTNANLADNCGMTPFTKTLSATADTEEWIRLWEKLLQHPAIDKAAIQQVAKRWGSYVVNAVESLLANSPDNLYRATSYEN